MLFKIIYQLDHHVKKVHYNICTLHTCTFGLLWNICILDCLSSSFRRHFLTALRSTVLVVAPTSVRYTPRGKVLLRSVLETRSPYS